jgi:radical SAM superfamily enzyme YgiQ (UPF0313 family)
VPGRADGRRIPGALGLAREAHLAKLFIGFESVNPGNRKELAGKGRGEAAGYAEVVKQIHKHGIGVVALFVFGFDGDTPQTFQAGWDFIRSSDLDGVSVTILTPYPGTVQRQELLAAGRILLPQGATLWERYDTNHVTYVPAQMSVEELAGGYDGLCRKITHPARIVEDPVRAGRGFRAWTRHPVPRMPSRLITSFSTDIGYRREFNHRLS